MVLSIVALVGSILSEVKDKWSSDVADALNFAEAIFGFVLSLVPMFTLLTKPELDGSTESPTHAWKWCLFILDAML